jgi:anion-transporting  ArsA/GET3 family ATPase
MISQALQTKRCLMVCGGGGVGKTTVAASLGIAATQYRKRVLVVTIDPSKRLAEAFGFTENALLTGGEPLKLSAEVKTELGVAEGAELSVGILNPKYVLDQILDQVLTADQRERLKRTMLYGQMSQMIYGLQEYTAYEWVTRLLREETYDFIVLDTPPAFHAKDFFNVPEKVTHLMESRVFQLFMPRKKTWLGSIMGQTLNFGWVEKLLGERIYNESRTFFEVFHILRDRILERCQWLAQFFTQSEVAVVAVGTPESSAQFELEGLTQFLKQKKIPLQGIVLNQVEMQPEKIDLSAPEWSDFAPELLEKIKQLRAHQVQKAERAAETVEKTRAKYPNMDLAVLPMNYSAGGFEILNANAKALSAGR